jgi:hypothetical protein
MAPPSWIDPTRELTDTQDRTTPREVFVRTQAQVLRGLGLSESQVLEAVAHAVTECGWGRRAIGHNMGGVKLKSDDDRAYRAKHGHGLSWWQWQGHAAAGDAPVVYYRAFEDDSDFWRFWLKRYVPNGETKGRYADTGKAFWSDTPSRWFVELLRAGYRGPVREAQIKALSDPNEHPSVKSHVSLVNRVRKILAASA